MDGLNFSPRNMQQLINNVLKDPAVTSVSLTTIGGYRHDVRGPVELGTECMSFRSDASGGATVIVPFHAIRDIRAGG